MEAVAVVWLQRDDVGTVPPPVRRPSRRRPCAGRTAADSNCFLVITSTIYPRRRGVCVPNSSTIIRPYSPLFVLIVVVKWRKVWPGFRSFPLLNSHAIQLAPNNPLWVSAGSLAAGVSPHVAQACRVDVARLSAMRTAYTSMPRRRPQHRPAKARQRRPGNRRLWEAPGTSAVGRSHLGNVRLRQSFNFLNSQITRLTKFRRLRNERNERNLILGLQLVFYASIAQP